jgi:hypothetical protein
VGDPRRLSMMESLERVAPIVAVSSDNLFDHEVHVDGVVWIGLEAHQALLPAHLFVGSFLLCKL